jgi:methylenetetrahydrofolate dehydrogenase (NADP+)/methenyltetrahydrofolate cyclohydrolase/formyltetrahydrofolate synthetase
LDEAYVREDLPLLGRGCANMRLHIQNALMFGVKVVVAINRFCTDSEAELQMVETEALGAGAHAAVVTNHWEEGGEGALALSQAVIDVCASRGGDFRFLYPLEMSIEDKIRTVCQRIYGAREIILPEAVVRKMQIYTERGYDVLPICIAKTHLSLSTNPSAKGVPTDFDVAIREIRASVGAGFLYLLAGDIMTIPGLPTRPGT